MAWGRERYFFNSYLIHRDSVLKPTSASCPLVHLRVVRLAWCGGVLAHRSSLNRISTSAALNCVPEMHDAAIVLFWCDLNRPWKPDGQCTLIALFFPNVMIPALVCGQMNSPLSGRKYSGCGVPKSRAKCTLHSGWTKNSYFKFKTSSTLFIYHWSILSRWMVAHWPLRQRLDRNTQISNENSFSTVESFYFLLTDGHA